MSTEKLIRLLSVIIAGNFFLLGQPTSTLQNVTPSQVSQRDPQAAAILQKAITAAGGSSLQSLRDFTADGQITQFQAERDLQGSIQIRSRGLDQLKVESRFDDGLHSIVFNHGKGTNTWSLLFSQNTADLPDARSVLKNAILASGGSENIRALNDFVATGTIQYKVDPNTPSSVVVRGRGLDQLEMESSIAGSTQTLVFNHGVGKLTTRGKTRAVLNVSGVGLLILPLPSLVKALDTTGTNISLLGIEEVQGANSYHLLLEPGLSANLASNKTLRALTTQEIWIDASTFMVTRLRHCYFPRNTNSLALDRQVSFSRFQRVNGVYVPSVITEEIMGQLTWTMQISTIQFNTGLSEDIFRQ